MNPLALFMFFFFASWFSCTHSAFSQDQIPLAQLVSSGEATVETSKTDIGSPSLLFDGKYSTLIRSAAINPLIVTIRFRDPITIQGVAIQTQGGPNDWNLQGGTNENKLISLFDKLPSNDNLWSSGSLSKPVKLRVLKLSVQRRSMDNYVHLSELVLYQEKVPSAIAQQMPEPFAIPQPRYLVDAQVIHKKVLAINFDPILRSKNNIHLHRYFNRPHPREQTIAYLNALEKVSGHTVKWTLIDCIDVDEYPIKEDGFQYTEQNYLAFRNKTSPPHDPDQVDYKKIIKDYRIVEKINNGSIDELIIWGADRFGYFESLMAGPKPYFVNGSPITLPGCKRNFIIMGLNYEVDLGFALHSFGHRSECLLWKAFGGWSQTENNNLWSIFSSCHKSKPNHSVCGNVHFPPNGMKDYDYGNPAAVPSTAHGWLNYPHINVAPQTISSLQWGAKQENFMLWWFAHMPKAPGTTTTGQQNNWWKYLVDFNNYPETAGP